MAKVEKLLQAVERAFDLSIRLNLPVIHGSTLLVISLPNSYRWDMKGYGLLDNDVRFRSARWLLILINFKKYIYMSFRCEIWRSYLA